MSDDTNDWRELREFAGVDLTRSYVLSWEIDAETLRIDIDLCLSPDHAFYEPPRPAERDCIRPAILEFPFCTVLRDRPPGGETGSPARVAEALGIGKIDGLRRIGDGHYEITGGFGRVEIEAERPLLRLKGNIA